MSTRALLRAWQKVRSDGDHERLVADLDLLQAKDLDLSVRLGAMLAFDALLATVAINPITASPGAPVSLDAPTQPFEVALVTISVLLLAVAAYQCVRALLIGEEFSDEGIADNPQAIIQRMLAAYCISIDAQRKRIATAVWLTIGGGALAVAVTVWIMVEKMMGH